MERVVHFDLNLSKPERAERFYKGAFGWKLDKWDGPMDYWMATTGKKGTPGIDGGFAKKDGSGNAPMPTLTIGVKGLDATIERVRKHGGRIVQKKMAIPGVGWFASFKDTEGNVLGIMQSDMKAK